MLMSPIRAAVGLDELLATGRTCRRSRSRGRRRGPCTGASISTSTRDDAAGRVELAALLAFGAGELGEEVLVDPAEDVLGAVLLVAEADVADQVDQLAEALLVERGSGVVLGQHALERGVVALDGDHGVVDDLADGRLLGVRLAGATSGLPCGTQKMLTARYSSGSSGSAPASCSASSLACCSSKASEMYFRKIRPRTTCLYSAASMLERSASAIFQSSFSKPRFAPCHWRHLPPSFYPSIAFPCGLVCITVCRTAPI